MADSSSTVAGRRLTLRELRLARPTLAEVWESPRLPLVAVLEDIRSLYNVGSIFRTADGAGLERILLCGHTGHPPRPEIEKTALGACEAVAWEYWSAAAEACRSLRRQGYFVVALEQTTRSRSVEEFDAHPPLALVVGNEVSGVSQAVLDEADAALEIPMAGVKESLNVAVAFGVAVYALRRSLQAGSPQPAAVGSRRRPRR